MPSRWKKAAPAALAALLFVALLGRTVRQLQAAPQLNWDILPAMALALEWEESDPLELHRRTYGHAREELAPRDFAELTAPGIRRARAEDPAAFFEHIAFYRSRILYTFAVWSLHRLGAPLSAATYWVPILCWASCAVLFLLWSARRLAFPLAAFFALGLAHTPALLNQATISSADGLATLWTVLGAWALIERRSFPLTVVFLGLAIGARPDAVILLGFVVAALFVALPGSERPRPRGMGLALGIGAVAYLGLERYGGAYGWWPVMQISFIEKALHPASLPTAVDWGEYGRILGRQIGLFPESGYSTTPAGRVTGSSLVLFYGALAGMGIALGHKERRAAALLGALLATYTLRFFLFPQLWDRFYAPFYALVPLCLLVMIRSPVKTTGFRR